MTYASQNDEIFIVDDDAIVSELLNEVLSNEGYRVTTFSDGQSFIAAAKTRHPAGILLDIFMPGPSGLDVLKEIDAMNYPSPIIIMSGNATIPMAVEAIKAGAIDIIEKPFETSKIVARVRELLEAAKRRSGKDGHSDSQPMEFPGIQRLTQREREVLAEITAAASNKEAGLHLGLSPRTIEVHRAHIMMKLGAKNTADLVRLVLNKRQANS